MTATGNEAKLDLNYYLKTTFLRRTRDTLYMKTLKNTFIRGSLHLSKVHVILFCRPDVTKGYATIHSSDFMISLGIIDHIRAAEARYQRHGWYTYCQRQ